MADFAAPVALGIKVPDAMASLGSVMGVAQNAQALQSGALNLEQKRATLPTDILQRKAESSSAQSSAQKAEQEMQERQAIAKMMKEGKDDMGNNILTDLKEPDPTKVIQALGRIAPLTGQDMAQKIMQTYTARIGLQGASTSLDSQQRAVLMGPIQAIATNPGDKSMVDRASEAIDQWAQAHPEMAKNADAVKLLLGHIRNAPNPEAAAKMANSLAATLQGGQAVQTQPQTANINTGGETLTGTTAPPVSGGGFSRAGAVTNTPAPAVVDMPGGKGNYQPPTSAGPGGITPVPGQAPEAGTAPTVFAGQSLKYPKREPGIPYAPGPSEAVDLQTGQQYRTGLISQQQALPTIKRNNEELLGQINKMMGPDFLSSGVIGAAKRNIQNWAGDPEYKQLSKDIANAQISMIKAGGGSLETDAGKSLVKYATGDETYPPKVLRNIAMRAGSDMTKTDMEATAAEKFAKQFGDNNLNTFKQEWSKNADSRIFEAINLYNSATNKAAVKPEIDKLLGGDAKQRKEYHQKYQNIMKLYNTGAL